VSLKNPLIPPGTDPGAVRLIAPRLNHYKQCNIYIILVGKLEAMFCYCVIKEYTMKICGRVKIEPIG